MDLPCAQLKCYQGCAQEKQSLGLTQMILIAWLEAGNAFRTHSFDIVSNSSSKPALRNNRNRRIVTCTSEVTPEDSRKVVRRGYKRPIFEAVRIHIGGGVVMTARLAAVSVGLHPYTCGEPVLQTAEGKKHNKQKAKKEKREREQRKHSCSKKKEQPLAQPNR